MTFEEYQSGILRTCGTVTTASKDNMLINAALGVAGEAGEVADLLKKMLFQEHPFDREHYIKEFGDVLYYVALGAIALDTTLEEIASTNNEKLWKRYPDGFKKDNSLNRKPGDV